MAEEFTHLTDSGVHMVEVGEKPDQKRRAIAQGSIFLDSHTIETHPQPLPKGRGADTICSWR